MTLYSWFVFFLVIQIVHFLGTWKMYESAGRKRWEAAIPIYNAIVLMKIIGRPTQWTILLFIPVINLIMFPVVWVETLRSFGRRSTVDTILVILTFGFYLYYINYTQPLNYIADRDTRLTIKQLILLVHYCLRLLLPLLFTPISFNLLPFRLHLWRNHYWWETFCLLAK